MKKPIAVIVLVLFLQYGYSQSADVYGLWYDSTSTYHFVTVDIGSGELDYVNTIGSLNTPTTNGSSIVIPDLQHYFFTGYDTASSIRYYTLDLTTGDVLYNVPANYTFLPCLHISTNSVYSLLFDNGTYYFTTLNYETGQLTFLDTLPLLQYQFTGTINPFTGEYIFLGKNFPDPIGSSRYYTIDLDNGSLIHDTIAMQSNPEFLFMLEIDTTDGSLYGLLYDETNYHFASVNHFTGEYSIISTLTEVESIFPGTSVFNAATGQFIFRGKKFSDPSGTNRYYVINASDGTIASNAIAEGDVRLLALNPDLNTGIKPTQKQFSFSLHPNPACDEVSITFPEKVTAGKLQIVNIQGKVILEETLNKSSSHINLEGIPAGLYFVTISDDDGNLSSRKLIKIKTEQ